ncbi:MAG: penicillin-binding protein activator [Alphaproteobacteria bacterium]|nr:penicillin-binding protein activator [Alphaproteobacteria bacterium]
MPRAIFSRFRFAVVPLLAALVVGGGGCEQIPSPFGHSQDQSRAQTQSRERPPPSPAKPAPEVQSKVQPEVQAAPLPAVVAAPAPPSVPTLVPLASRAPTAIGPENGALSTMVQVPAGPVRVALLVPLSGTSSGVGEAMLNGAQLALFDSADANFVLQVYDTGGSAEGAATAAATALQEGARLIVGPVFSAAVKAVAPLARNGGVPVIAFSTDTAAAGPGVFLMGFLPRQQVQRVALHARSQGLTRFAALAPSTEYGRTVTAALRETVTASGGNVTEVEYYDPAAPEHSPTVRRVAARHAFDAILVPDKGPRLKALASLLPYFEVDLQKVRLLGTLLWADTTFAGEPALVGGWYAVPSGPLQKPFATRYRQVFGAAPPDNTSLAYDAIALVATLARAPGGPKFDLPTLTADSGFAGVDGIFRFRPDGTTERGLAVMEVTASGPTEISPAPTSFEKPLY